MIASLTTVVFDLGGVLVDWNPRYLYRDLFRDDAAMEYFLSEVCSPDWNLKQDAGRSFAEAEREAIARHPDSAAMVKAWLSGFDKMMQGPIVGTVQLLAALRAEALPLYALSNWSAETFPIARKRFDFLSWFDGIVMSGEERLIKPDAALYRVLSSRYGVDPAHSLFIDDNATNVEAARSLGFTAHHFVTPDALHEELRQYKLLP